jgi:peptidoglycan/xylan/chitin deacetylase (PgdA/CDA1 family)
VQLGALRRELDAAASPRTFFFRDDDAGWASDRLFALLDVFEAYGVPLDVAVIPAALDGRLAGRLLRRGRASVAFHQHGLAHANHEPSGRACEFGPSRSVDEQRRDIEAGARRLAELLGETEPVFTPPWNRCTEETGRCLLDLGFRALSRDSAAAPLGLDGLLELQVHVDWARPDRVARLVTAARDRDRVGVMLHHALMGPAERGGIAELLALLTSHANARCERLYRPLNSAGRFSRNAVRPSFASSEANAR